MLLQLFGNFDDGGFIFTVVAQKNVKLLLGHSSIAPAGNG
jgi:hypothetical protein